MSVQYCINCGINVIPTKENTCPNCRNPLSSPARTETAKVDVEAVTVDKEAVIPSPIEKMQKNENVFYTVAIKNDEQKIYKPVDIEGVFKDDLMNGVLTRKTVVHTHKKGADNKWTETTLPLYDFAKGHYPIGVLYRPVYHHAMTGLVYGIYAGIGLKVLDLVITMFAVQPLAGIMTLVAIAIAFIPKYGFIGVILFSIWIARNFEGPNFYLMIFSSIIAGVILGILPGMGMGGIIGFIRSGKRPKAPDAELEKPSVLFKLGILPLFLGIGLVLAYIFLITPWLLSIIE